MKLRAFAVLLLACMALAGSALAFAQSPPIDAMPMPMRRQWSTASCC